MLELNGPQLVTQHSSSANQTRGVCANPKYAFQLYGIREIARMLGRSPSTISRELRRNAATRGGTLIYRATVAQWKAELAAKRPKAVKLAESERL